MNNRHFSPLLFSPLLWAYSPLDLGCFFSFLIYRESVGFLGQGISPSQGRYLHTEKHKHRINAQETSMPWLGFKPRIPAFERAKTVHALERPATVISWQARAYTQICINHCLWHNIRILRASLQPHCSAKYKQQIRSTEEKQHISWNANIIKVIFLSTNRNVYV
jgi:hypothetical protein